MVTARSSTRPTAGGRSRPRSCAGDAVVRIARLGHAGAHPVGLAHALVAEGLEHAPGRASSTSVHGPTAADLGVELLRRGVAGRAHHEVAAGGRERDADRLVEDLGEPEVEHLDARGARPRGREEEVRGLDVPVHDALPVRVVEREGGGLEQRQDLGHGPAAQALACADRASRAESGMPSSHSSTRYGTSAPVVGAVVVELVMHRTMSRLPCPRRKSSAPLVAEPPREGLVRLGVERRLQLEALDGDGLAQPRCVARYTTLKPPSPTEPRCGPGRRSAAPSSPSGSAPRASPRRRGRRRRRVMSAVGEYPPAGGEGAEDDDDEAHEEHAGAARRGRLARRHGEADRRRVRRRRRGEGRLREGRRAGGWSVGRGNGCLDGRRSGWRGRHQAHGRSRSRRRRRGQRLGRRSGEGWDMRSVPPSACGPDIAGGAPLGRTDHLDRPEPSLRGPATGCAGWWAGEAR